jgi:hypothetical protein
MTQSLREALADLADAAPDYARPEPAVAAAQRGRRVRTALSGAAAVLVVILMTSAVALVRIGAQHESAGSPRSGVSPSPVGPIAVDAPMTEPPPSLPAGKLGPALLVYSTCVPTCARRVVLRDGQQYTLGDSAPELAYRTTEMTLSPDGRWLLVVEQRQPAESTLIDLLTGARRTVPVVLAPLAWSPESDVLLYRGERGLSGLRPETGETWSLPAQLTTRYGYLLSGQEIVGLQVAGTNLIAAKWSLTGQRGGGAEVALGDSIHGRESPAIDRVLAQVPGEPLIVPVYAEPADPTTDPPSGVPSAAGSATVFNHLTALLVVDVDAGVVTRRVEITEAALQPLAINADGLLAERWMTWTRRATRRPGCGTSCRSTGGPEPSPTRSSSPGPSRRESSSPAAPPPEPALGEPGLSSAPRPGSPVRKGDVARTREQSWPGVSYCQLQRSRTGRSTNWRGTTMSDYDPSADVQDTDTDTDTGGYGDDANVIVSEYSDGSQSLVGHRP